MEDQDIVITPEIDPIGFKLPILGIIILSALAGFGFINFLLFHTIAEFFSIVIAFSIFIVSWNTRNISNNNFLLFLGITYLFVGILDFTHTLAYKGMNIFSGFGANLPTQLWIISRYLESFSLAFATVFFYRRLNIRLSLLIFSSIVVLAHAVLFMWPVFPDCFIENSGLTHFKTTSEFIISLFFIGTIIILYRNRDKMENSIFSLIIASMFLKVLCEFAFTFYAHVYDLSNILGHSLKILSFYLIYQALIVATLSNPFNSLFRKVVESKNEKERIIVELKESLEKVKLLEGFLPICASCKQIRDDRGYWNQIESYISKRSEVTFSHSICPECVKKLYPEFSSEVENRMGKIRKGKTSGDGKPPDSASS